MCNKSESIAKIAAALVAFSGEVKSIAKDATNPHFKSDYTSLDHMIDETKPLLHKHGLTVMQFPGGDGEKVTVRTMILHTSGEWIESEPLTLKAVKMDPQGAGSAITYARRYSYAAALSLSLGDDDDGNAASQTPQRQPQSTGQAQPSQQSSRPPQQPTSPSGGGKTISDAQVNYCYRLKKEKHINDNDFTRLIGEYGDGDIEIKNLSMTAAREFINFLNAYIVQPEEEGELPVR